MKIEFFLLYFSHINRATSNQMYHSIFRLISFLLFLRTEATSFNASSETNQTASFARDRFITLLSCLIVNLCQHYFAFWPAHLSPCSALLIKTHKFHTFINKLEDILKNAAHMYVVQLFNDVLTKIDENVIK